MKSSLLFFGCFTIGILVGRIDNIPTFIADGNYELYLLYFLIFLVGINISSDTKVLQKIFQVNIRTFLVPLLVIIGSLMGIGLTSLLLSEIGIKDSFAIGAGFGYYSLSSVIITQISGDTLGVLALLTNLIREVFTILFAPLLVKTMGKLAPIASGGATTMDTTLPIIQKNSGSKYAVVAVINGLVLSILVPLLVPIFLV